VFNTSTSNNSNIDFNKIRRDTLGNFFVYSTNFIFTATGMCLAKFDTSFTFLWAKTSSDFILEDIDVLPNGRIFASGNANIISGYAYNAALMKFDSQGNCVSQCYIDRRGRARGLCKKPNGNYISSISRSLDSLSTFETDTMMNISWSKLQNKGRCIGSSVIENNTLITPVLSHGHPVLTSSDLNGNNCTSLADSLSKITTNYSLSSFTLSPISCSATIVSHTDSAIDQQNYTDSCNCTILQTNPASKNICINTTSTLSVVGSNTVNWYSSPTGTNSIGSGSNIVYSSGTTTVSIFYVRDPMCYFTGGNVSITLTVNPVPSLTLSPISPTVCLGKPVTLMASGATFYHWEFSNEDWGFINDDTVSVTLLSSEILTVTGTGGYGCSDTKTLSVIVNTNVPSLSVTPLQFFCQGVPFISFSVSGANSYLWSNGITTNSFAVNSPSTNLSYTVSSTLGACTSTVETMAILKPSPTVTMAASASSICAGESVTLSSTGASTFDWISIGSDSLVVVNPTANTIYTLTGTNTNYCTDTQTLEISVSQQPTLSVSVSAYSVCEGASVTLSVSGANSYSWSTGDSTNSFNVSALLGNTIYTVIGANGSCTRTTSAFVYASAIPTLNFVSSPTVFCEGKTATISVFGANTYSWSNSSTTNSIVITPTANVNYSVSAANGNCFSSDSINLIVYANPTLVISASDQDICVGETITLLANGAAYYNWNTGSTVNIIFQSPQTNTVYSVIGTNAVGCSDLKTASISVNPLPLIILNTTQSVVCAGETSTLSASGGISYAWNGIPGTSTIAISPLINTSFTVSVVDINGCSGQNTIDQFVSLCTDLQLLNQRGIFISASPNPSNGQFQLDINIFDKHSTLEIYNVIGELVWTQKIEQQTSFIDLKNQAAGVFYLKLCGQQKPVTLKMVKQ